MGTYETSHVAEVMEEGQNLTRVPKKKGNPQTRAWCFTLNNYKEKDVINSWEWIEEHCAYGIMAFEYSNDGTPHLQGYWRVQHQPMRYIFCGGLFPLSKKKSKTEMRTVTGPEAR